MIAKIEDEALCRRATMMVRLNCGLMCAQQDMMRVKGCEYGRDLFLFQLWKPPTERRNWRESVVGECGFTFV